MSEKDTLTRRQSQFVASVTTQPTILAAAEHANIAPKTAWRYLKEPAVKDAIRERQEAMLAQVTGGLVQDMADARAVLLGIALDDGASDAARVSAARAILDIGAKLFELYALSDRVADLEQAVSIQRTWGDES